jgi:FlaA1/EpsC-like NDP-sugar epimerase
LFPLGIIVIEGALTFLGMTGARFVPRIVAERRRAIGSTAGTPTLLMGAGRGGLAIVKEALRHPDLGIRPVGFLDDDRTKAGMELHNLRVLGTRKDAERIILDTGATQLIITSAEISPKVILELMDACRPHGVTLRIVSGLYELLDKKLSAANLRELRIEDLLSRDPVPPSLSMHDLTEAFGGRRILVTGAGGSIGSELCRQLVLMNPEKLLMAERDETNLFEIDRQLNSGRLDDCCVPILVDITNQRDLERLFKEHAPQVVFHAAAYKHVPVMERFPAAAVGNNVFGTQRLVEIADQYGVEQFVMISTDKAVRPTSVMGATKRFAEMIVQDSARESKTAFSCVRFGNVLGSRGSVVGIFRGQIQSGGPVTVTHPEATRSFMTIPEAANLVIQAATLGKEGEVFLLDMGEPIKIMDLARQLIHLSGATEESVPIKIVGTRPGEKLFEELRTDAEHIEKTPLRKVFRCSLASFEPALLSSSLERLQFLVRSKDHGGIRECLRDLDIGYTPKSTVADSDAGA